MAKKKETAPEESRQEQMADLLTLDQFVLTKPKGTYDHYMMALLRLRPPHGRNTAEQWETIVDQTRKAPL
jgi:hypothetical protein